MADGSTPAEPPYDLIDQRLVDVTENVFSAQFETRSALAALGPIWTGSTRWKLPRLMAEMSFMVMVMPEEMH
jgi:hypothetical protein